MTLVLSVHSRDTLWLLVDRRLSYRNSPPVDDAIKVMNLETTDGIGLLGYAGLGATSEGTQPSDWMSAVLRGRSDLTFEQALGVLSAAAVKQLPKHLARMPGGGHFIVIPAFVRGAGSRLYSIDNVVDRRTQRHWYRYTRHQREAPGSPSVRLAVGGTGGVYLANDKSWQRALLSLVNAHDRGRVSDCTIADQLARLNHEAHQGVRDGSVGPRCIVIWRRRPDAQHSDSGGGHQFYTGLDRDRDSAAVPTIANGMDVQAIVGVLTAQFQARVTSPGFSPGDALDFDKDEIDRMFAELPWESDEKLR